ncbi:hypothetical protein ACWEIJ_01840 [Lentzea sp. NPDC004789]
MSEEDGALLLGPLRAVDVPASTGVNVQRAIRSGKRTKALRVTAAGAFVLIVAGLLPLMIRPAAAPAPAAGAFDPFVRTISAGPVPGLQTSAYFTGRERQLITLTPEPGGHQSGLVEVNAAGAVGTPSGEPMPDVNGRRALWTGTTVAVEWERGAWAFVQVQGFPDDRDRARLLAESLSFDEHVQIRFPFTVETSWQLDGVRDTSGVVELVFTNGVRVSSRGAEGSVPYAELREVSGSVRPADPPVTNPLR